MKSKVVVWVDNREKTVHLIQALSHAKQVRWQWASGDLLLGIGEAVYTVPKAMITDPLANTLKDPTLVVYKVLGDILRNHERNSRERAATNPGAVPDGQPRGQGP